MTAVPDIVEDPVSHYSTLVVAVGWKTVFIMCCIAPAHTDLHSKACVTSGQSQEKMGRNVTEQVYIYITSPALLWKPAIMA